MPHPSPTVQLTSSSFGRQQKKKGLLAAMDSPSLDTGEGLGARGGDVLWGWWVLFPFHTFHVPKSRGRDVLGFDFSALGLTQLSWGSGN